MTERLPSEDVIISAPMSYAGSTQRIMRIRRGKEGGQLVAMTVLAVVLMVAAWTVITGWYICFSVLLVPYRLIRRSDRKAKREALQHREMMAVVLAANGVAPPDDSRELSGAEPPALPQDSGAV